MHERNITEKINTLLMLITNVLLMLHYLFT